MTPAGRAGPVTVEVVSGRGNQSQVLFGKYLYKEPDLLLGVTPSVCPENGGIVITVAGEHFVAGADALCRFGSIVEEGVSVSNKLLVCRCPANRAGDVYLEVSSNGIDFSVNKIQFVYSSQTIIFSAFPSVVISSVQTIVHLHITPDAPAALYCYFGNWSVEAFPESSSRLSCESPVHAPGDIVLSIGGAERPFSTRVKFTFLEAPHITSLNPSMWPSSAVRTTIRIVGTGFDTAGASCMFGEEEKVAAIIRSSSVALCKSSVQGDTQGVEVKLFFDKMRYMTNGIKLHYYERPVMMKIIPSVVSHKDVKSVTIYGDSFASSGGKVFVHIGSSNILEASLISNTELRCKISSLLHEGNFSVLVSLQNGVFARNDTVFLRFVKDSQIRVLPTVGHMRGGTVVFVYGFGLDNGIGKCSFGTLDVQLSLSSSSAAMCISPPSSKKVVTLAISINGSILVNETFRFKNRMEIIHVESSLPSSTDRLRVVGSAFSTEDVLSCRFNRLVEKEAFVFSSTYLLCSMPPIRSLGIELEIINFHSQEVSNPVKLRFTHPIVYSISPRKASSNSLVTITGYFSQLPYVIKFAGTHSFAYSVLSSSKLLVRVPKLDPGTYALSVSMTEEESLLQSSRGMQWIEVSPQIRVSSDSPDGFAISSNSKTSNIIEGVKDDISSFNFIQLFESYPKFCFVGNPCQVFIVGVFPDPNANLKCRALNQVGSVKFLSSSRILCSVAVLDEGNFTIQVCRHNLETCLDFSFALHVLPSWRLFQVAPSTLPMSTEIQLRIIGKSFPPHLNISCMFGISMVRQARRVSSSLVLCQSPRLAYRNITFNLKFDTIVIEHENQQIVILPNVHLKFLLPSSDQIIQGTKITLTGAGLDPNIRFACRFHGLHGREIDVLAHSATFDELICDLPNISTITSIRGVSITDLHERSSNVLPLELALCRRRVSYFPSQGPVSGGTLVKLIYELPVFAQEVKLIWGNLALDCSIIGNIISFITPAWADLSIEIESFLSVDGVNCKDSSITYRYVHNITVEQVLYHANQSTIEIIGKGFEASTFCLMNDSLPILPSELSENRVKCDVMNPSNHGFKLVIRSNCSASDEADRTFLLSSLISSEMFSAKFDFEFSRLIIDLHPVIFENPGQLLFQSNELNLFLSPLKEAHVEVKVERPYPRQNVSVEFWHQLSIVTNIYSIPIMIQSNPNLLELKYSLDDALGDKLISFKFDSFCENPSCRVGKSIYIAKKYSFQVFGCLLRTEEHSEILETQVQCDDETANSIASFAQSSISWISFSPDRTCQSLTTNVILRGAGFDCHYNFKCRFGEHFARSSKCLSSTMLNCVVEFQQLGNFSISDVAIFPTRCPVQGGIKGEYVLHCSKKYPDRIREYFYNF
eukprot:764035-Hanusia_phi.AAC.2